jgi:hypothetical protein
MCSGRSDTPLRVPGFPIRTSTDRSSVGSSPWLIAASHVLLRLQAPRHPPLALRSLKNKDARARYRILKGRALTAGSKRPEKPDGDAAERREAGHPINGRRHRGNFPPSKNTTEGSFPQNGIVMPDKSSRAQWGRSVGPEGPGNDRKPCLVRPQKPRKTRHTETAGPASTGLLNMPSSQ